MKANELMINDWVCLENDNTPRQVDWIRSGEVGLFWNQIVTPPYLKPIPLTPEILEKNGFVENNGSTSWEFKTNRDTLIIIYGIYEYHLSINIEATHGCGKGYRWLLNDITIFYVHQLQQILRVFRIEKDIIL